MEKRTHSLSAATNSCRVPMARRPCRVPRGLLPLYSADHVPGLPLEVGRVGCLPGPDRPVLRVRSSSIGGTVVIMDTIDTTWAKLDVLEDSKSAAFRAVLRACVHDLEMSERVKRVDAFFAAEAKYDAELRTLLG
jgi:hypothetical protein